MGKRVLIMGFPHSGTTILRELINRCDNGYAHTEESKDIKTFIGMPGVECIKWPYVEDVFLSDEYKDVTKVFIIRNPLYVFSSIERRNGNITRPYHNIEDWQHIARLFLSTYPYANTIKIKYEDLFLNGAIHTLLDTLGLEYTNDIFNGTATELTTTDKQHAQYRMEQIQLPFTNMNTSDKLTLSKTKINQIKKTPEFKRLY